MHGVFHVQRLCGACHNRFGQLEDFNVLGACVCLYLISLLCYIIICGMCLYIQQTINSVIMTPDYVRR